MIRSWTLRRFSSAAPTSATPTIPKVTARNSTDQRPARQSAGTKMNSSTSKNSRTEPTINVGLASLSSLTCCSLIRVCSSGRFIFPGSHRSSDHAHFVAQLLDNFLRHLTGSAINLLGLLCFLRHIQTLDLLQV